MVNLSAAKELERTSTINKTKSPVVQKYYKARANKVSKEDVTTKQSEQQVQFGPGEPEKKVFKATGMGRHRSIDSSASVKSQDVRDDVSYHTEPSKVSSDKHVTVVTDDDDEVSTPLCGLCM